MNRSQFLSALVASAFGLLASACGVQGDKGEALFVVESSWAKATPIALESTFAVNASRSSLFKTALTVESADPTVFVAQGGAFRAAGEGLGRFRAVDPSTKEEVDTITYEVAKPSQASLSYWADKILDPQSRLPVDFALASGSQPQVRVELTDKLDRPMNHKGIAKLTADAASHITFVDKTFHQEASAGAPGSGKVELAVAGAGGKSALTKSYGSQVVDAKDIASLTIASGAVVLNLNNLDKNKPNQPPAEDADAKEPSDQSTVYVLVLQAKTAGGVRVYGAAGTWTVVDGTAKPTHLDKPSEVNYLTLQKGEKVTLQVELNGKTTKTTVTGQ